jgi:hypothetical protein
MGIVNQSLKTVITYLYWFGGGVNTIYLYPVFLGLLYGLTNYITSCKCDHAIICNWDAKYTS